MKIINKQTKREMDVTPQEFEALSNQSEQHKTLYQVVEQEAPPTPKEVKKMSGTKQPESDNGSQTNTDRLPDQNAG